MVDSSRIPPPPPPARAPARTDPQWVMYVIGGGLALALVGAAIGLFGGDDPPGTSPVPDQAITGPGSSTTTKADVTTTALLTSEESPTTSSGTTTETAAAAASPGAAECPAAAESSTSLLSGQNLALTGTFEESAFVEDVGGGVLLEGEGGISFSFCTSGGPVSGLITVTLAGEDNDGITHTVSYTGTLNGDYDPVRGLFDGTVSWSGDVPSGFEAVFPSDTVWDGFVLLEPFGCEEIGDCISGGTEPDLDAYWNIELPPEAVNPANG